jgi:hypothetical protein
MGLQGGRRVDFSDMFCCSIRLPGVKKQREYLAIDFNLKQKSQRLLALKPIF